MQRFMQIGGGALRLRLEALKGRWVLTLPANIQVGLRQLSHHRRAQKNG